MLQVANGKQTGFIGKNKLYIGRQNLSAGLPESPLANPFKIGPDGDRDAVVQKYRTWLWQQIQGENETVLNELWEIHDRSRSGVLKLTCWCHPRPCHGDVIVNCVSWLAEQNSLFKVK